MAQSDQGQSPSYLRYFRDATTPSRTRRKYRQYIRDNSTAIPRQTLWRHKKQVAAAHLSLQGVIGPQSQIPRLSPLHCSDAMSVDCPSSYGVSPSKSPSPTIPSSSPPVSSTCDVSLSSTSPPCVAPSPPVSVSSSPCGSLSVSSESLTPSQFSPDESLPFCCLSSSCESESPSPPDKLSLPLTSPKDKRSNFPPDLFSPIYTDAEITLCGALYAIMQFCTSNKLTYTAIGELLKLISLLCPSGSILPKSFFRFKKFFQRFKEINQCHTLKKVCLECMKDVCSCGNATSSTNIAHLVNVEIHKPLQAIISRNWKSLVIPTKSNILYDVWDGSALSPLCAPGRFFSSKNHLALSLSTDGVPLFKSSKVSLWPVYLVILNLPANVRTNSENVILCGLWVGPTKPVMKLLLDPVMLCIQQLSTLGLDIVMKSGDAITIRAKLVMGVFDLPAKAAVLCAKQFNGKFGCSVCLHPGKRLSNNSRVYLPDTFTERTNAGVVSAGRQAEQTKLSVQGVYGISPLAFTIDLVTSIPVDYMHCVLEGVTKWLMNSWFDSKNHVAPFYIGTHVKEIDRELLKQRPPSEFSRPPRSIQKHFKYWKASEFRYWLLYYSLPLLLHHLPSLYWHHYALLVCAMHIMLSDSITQAQIDAAEQMLSDFYHLMPELYGESSCTHNCHLLSHLAKYVRLWGPLWTHSAFGFENKNGCLKHLFHGKTDIIHQLLFNTDVSYTLQCVHDKLVDVESDQTIAYVDKLSKLAPRPNMACIGNHLYVVGKCKAAMPTVEQSLALAYSNSIDVFSRLLKDRTMYCSTSYLRSGKGKRDNTHCYYRDDDGGSCIGVIELFSSKPKLCAFVREVKTLQPTLINAAGHPCRTTLNCYQQADLLNSYITPVEISTGTDQLLAVPLDSIICKAVIVTVSGIHYCLVQPNNIERH